MNFHPPFTEATTSICGLNVDSGNYEPALDRALELADYEQLRKEQQARRERGDAEAARHRALHLHRDVRAGARRTSWARCGTRPAAGTRRRSSACPTGKVVVETGTSPHGQGHETTWSQIVADGLGVTPDDIEVLHGDTQVTPLGMDTYGSRSSRSAASALHFAMEKIKEKARTIAAHELEVVRGRPRVHRRRVPREGRARQGADDPGAGVSRVARAQPARPGSSRTSRRTAVYDPPNFTWPAGTHICVVEVDTETGAVDIIRYVAVDDCGTVINPMIVEGQVHGGVAQGIAEALYEEAIYDESGNLVDELDDAVPGARRAEMPAH